MHGAVPVGGIFANKDVSVGIGNEIIGLCCNGHDVQGIAENFPGMLYGFAVGKMICLGVVNYGFCIADKRFGFFVPLLARNKNYHDKTEHDHADKNDCRRKSKVAAKN